VNFESLRARIGEVRSLIDNLKPKMTFIEDSLPSTQLPDISADIARLRQFLSSAESELSIAEKKAQKTAEARATLEKFMRVAPPSEDVKGLLEKHKSEVSTLLCNEKSEFDVRPYALFVLLVESPFTDLSLEDGDFLDDFFGRAATRPLYQGKFTFENGAEAMGTKATDMRETSKPTKNQNSKNVPSPEETTAVEPFPDRELQYSLNTEKEHAQFSVKSFLSGRAWRTKNGQLRVEPLKRGELALLLLFASCGALSQCQLKILVSGRMNETALEYLRKDGLITEIVHKNTGAKFFALSKNGAEVFRKEKSRALMKIIGKSPLEVLTASRSVEYMEIDPEAYSCILSASLYIASGTRDAIPILGAAASKALCAHMPLPDCDGGSIAVFPHSEISKLEGVFQIAKTLSAKKLVFAIADQKPDFPFSAGFNRGFKGKIYFCQVHGSQLGMTFFTASGTVLTLKELLSSNDTTDKPAKIADNDAEDAGETVSEAPADIVYDLNDPFVLARQMLDNGVLPDRRDLFEALSNALLRCEASASLDDATDYLGRAVILNQTLAVADEARYGDNYRRLLFAVDFKLDACRYTGEELAELFGGEWEGTAAHLAALLRALFAPDSPVDYHLHGCADDLFERYDKVFSGFYMLKPTLNEFLSIRASLREGFSDAIISRFLNVQMKDNVLSRLKDEAERLKNPPSISQRLRGMPKMLGDCFGAGSELGACVKIVAENRVSERGRVLTVYENFTNGVSQDQIAIAFDKAWEKIRKNSDEHVVPDIVGPARKKIVDAFQERLAVIGQWLDYTKADKEDDPKLQSLYVRITFALNKARDAVRDSGELSLAERAIFLRALHNMLAALEGAKIEYFKPKDWLSRGVFSVDRAGAPRIERGFSEVRYYELWRNALRHIAREPRDLREVLRRIEDERNIEGEFDNLGQAIAICEYLTRNGESVDMEIYRKSIDGAEQFAEKQIMKFKEQLELDLFYGRVSEQSRQNALDTIEYFKSAFWETRDFACLRAFLRALRRVLDDEIDENRARWALNVGERWQIPHSPEKEIFLKCAERFLTAEDTDFGLIEEALNNFDSKASLTAPESVQDEENLFAEFIADENFGALHKVCSDKQNKMGTFSSFACAYVRKQLEKAGRSTQCVTSAQKLVSSLPNRPAESGEIVVKALLEGLGFTVIDVKRSNPGKPFSRFTVSMTPDIINRENYDHPIAEMGTKLPRQFDVVEFFGNMEPEMIVDNVRNLELRHMSVVLLNGTLDRLQRRRLAERFLKGESRQAPFVLIDWVLLLHLAMKRETDRVRTMLACGLPYTGAKQLFAQTGALADEMFVGRTQELSQILDMDGPVIVYGGRRLGKTALLERARNLFHLPQSGDYGVFINATSCRDERSFVEAAAKGFSEAGLAVTAVDTVSQFCGELRQKFNNGECKRVLLLFDETDALLASFSKYERKPLEALADLRCRTSNNFKFIFAGLHDVFLATRYPNSIFGQFGKPLCVRPMSRADARKLLSRPLKYLGFRADDRLLERLLVSANFYPGIVHLVGSKIVELLTQQYAEHYKVEKNPPYELTDRQIGAIMNSSDLSNQINERIRLMLEVDLSYFALACCIAWLCYENEGSRGQGCRVSEIRDCAEMLGIDELRLIGEDGCSRLLSELCEMGILVEKDGLYRFRQGRFLRIIGKNTEDIESRIARMTMVGGNERR
jgi:hypothetical protein